MDCGLVVFPFGWRGRYFEPNPCNIRLAEEAVRIAENEQEFAKVIPVVPWHVASQLQPLGLRPGLVVGSLADGCNVEHYVLWQAAKKYFGSQGVRNVIPVAQPFLQLRGVKRMIATDGFSVISRRVRWIGFDNHTLNDQLSARSAVALLLEAGRDKLGI